MPDSAPARARSARRSVVDMARVRGVALTALFGSAVLIGLVLAGWAEPTPAVAGALLIATVGAAFAWREVASARRSTVDRPPSPTRAGDSDLPFGLAVERLPAPFLLVAAGDPGGAPELVYVNLAGRDLLRVGRSGGDLTSALRDPDVLEAVDESLFGGLTRIVALEGGGAQQRVWSVWSSPLPSVSGQRRAVLLMRDETELRRAERLRADFLANASHELRTPLASLTGFIETLRGHARDDPAARERFLGIMAAQGERMGRLIDDLLSLSRVELNEHVPPSGVCDLAAAVRDTLDALAPLAAERGVTLSLERLDPARVTGDRDQLVQVAQNLVDNALKFSGVGGVVTVGLRADLGMDAVQASLTSGLSGEGGGRMALLTPDRRAGERFALLQVRDSGPGMAREHLPRLAERFYRVEGQKSGPRAGTGLGLAIVKHIVNRHRGGLVVESAPGRGAVFSVYVPCATTARAEVETKLS